MDFEKLIETKAKEILDQDDYYQHCLIDKEGFNSVMEKYQKEFKEGFHGNDILREQYGFMHYADILTFKIKKYPAEKEWLEKKMAKAVAKLTYSFASATVPKVSVVTGEAYGSAYLTMNSKSIGADIVYAWPEASIGMMDAQAAAKIMYADEIKGASDANALIAEKAAEYGELQSSAQAAARRGYVDDIIEAQDSRKYIIGAFEMLFTKREDRPVKKHGCV